MNALLKHSALIVALAVAPIVIYIGLPMVHAPVGLYELFFVVLWPGCWIGAVTVLAVAIVRALSRRRSS